MARERDVRNAIQELLLATGAFSTVWITGLPEDYGQGASSLTAAAIEPVSTQLTSGWDSSPPGGWTTHPNYPYRCSRGTTTLNSATSWPSSYWTCSSTPSTDSR